MPGLLSGPPHVSGAGAPVSAVELSAPLSFAEEPALVEELLHAWTHATIDPASARNKTMRMHRV
jgi:hypothetical protein